MTEIDEKEECVDCGEPLEVVARVEDRKPCPKCNSTKRKRIVTVNEKIKHLSDITNSKIAKFDDAKKYFSEFQEFSKKDKNKFKLSEKFKKELSGIQFAFEKWSDIKSNIDNLATLDKKQHTTPKTEDVTIGTDTVNKKIDHIQKQINDLPKEPDPNLIEIIKELMQQTSEQTKIIKRIEKQTANSKRNMIITGIISFFAGICSTIVYGFFIGIF